MCPAFRNPSSAAFFKHWDDLRQGDLRQLDFRQGALAPHHWRFLDAPPFALMPSVIILEIHDANLRIRFMGTALVRLCRRDFTDESFHAAVPQAENERVLGDVGTICGHPVGARVVTQAETNKRRKVDIEVVCLPLAVDENQRPRCVQYRAVSGDFDFDEHKTSLSWSKPEWIDIGAGLPRIGGSS